jgi:hypothetical protein
LAAATVLGLGALTAADIHDMDQFGSPQFGSHQRGPHLGHGDRQFDQRFGQIPNFSPPGN